MIDEHFVQAVDAGRFLAVFPIVASSTIQAGENATHRMDKNSVWASATIAVACFGSKSAIAAFSPGTA
jgi:hypothetical protein